MGRYSIAELVERFLFYFSFSIRGILRRRKMEENYNCNVFAGEEEVTPRHNSPVVLPTLPIELPRMPEGGLIPHSGGSPEHPEMPHLPQPQDDIIPWCPTPTTTRRSTRRRAQPAVYTTTAATTARKTKKRLPTKKVSRTGRRKRPASAAARRRKPRRASPPSRPHSSPGPNPHTPMMSGPPTTTATTPKVARAPGRRRIIGGASGAAAASGGGGGSRSIRIPKAFIVTVEELKREKK